MVVVRRQEEERAKVGGRCVIADGKFQPSGISGKVTGKGHGSKSPEMPDGWNFPSAITHLPPTFARSSSYLRTTTISLIVIGCTFTSTMFIAHEPSKPFYDISW
jgi:hypothetical protein